MFIVSNSCISNLKQNGTWTIEKSLPNLVVYDILFNSLIDCSGLSVLSDILSFLFINKSILSNFTGPSTYGLNKMFFTLL